MDKKIFFDLEFSSNVSKEKVFEEICSFYILDNWSEIILTDNDVEKISIKTKEELYDFKNRINEIAYIKFENKNSETFHFQLKHKKNQNRVFCSGYKENNNFPLLFTYIQKYKIKSLIINNDADYYTQCFGTKPSTWEYKEMSIPDYAKLVPGFDYDNPDYKEIDIESLPGHEHIMGYGDGLRFGAYYQMYFSDTYYKYIPKPLFDDFKDCEENIILENGLRKITLYKDVNDFLNPANRARQWAFRKQLGVDTIAHELQDWQQVDFELPVVITQLNCEKGQTKVTRYLSKENQLVSPSQAETKEIKEYLEDGITVVFEKIEKLK